ncbi:YbaN family protein [Endozoicomonas sp. ALC013]|uniref:YbaN family protein n=1 Tax=Endozoicomonas sp. ALC013 TaxID=3403076 RepID=UPI003BB4E1D9
MSKAYPQNRLSITMNSRDKTSPLQSPGILIRNSVLRYAFKACALLCVALGCIGIFLPLLPTTPFLLLAVFFSLRSSPTIHARLLNHPTLDPPLRQYLNQRSISTRVYIRAVIFLWLTISLSIWLLTLPWLKYLLLTIAITVTLYLTKLKRREKRP